MKPANTGQALIACLAGVAAPWEPEQVVSMAAEALALEAKSIADAHDKADCETVARLWVLAGRLRALEHFVDCLEIKYQRRHEDSFAFDASEETESKGDESEAAQ